ncbi:MAG: alpha/beta hydrolase-fold protein, partial [Ignavibacteriaceae bacterium]
MFYRLIFVLTLIINQILCLAQVRTQTLTLGEQVEFRSKVLDESRKILIHLPENYDRFDQRYPVLYVLDGEFFFTQVTSAVQYLSELGYIRNQPIPQLIVVGIVNVDRNRDYTPTYAPKQDGLEFPTSGKAKKFLEFLKSELFPLIESNYRTEQYRVIAGWSLGGLFSVFTYLEHPEYFSAYLAISPSLWWDKDLYVGITKDYIKQKMIPKKKITVTIGSLEGGDMGRSVRDGFITLMKNQFGSDDFFKTVEIPDESHSYVYYKAIYEGLQLLYSDWQMPEELLENGIEAIKTFYSNLSQKYGYKISVPEAAYSNLANYTYNQVSTEAAIDIAKLYVNAFPNSSYAYFRLGIFNQLASNYKIAKGCYQKALEL